MWKLTSTLYFILPLVFLSIEICAQNVSQPTIMVIPYTTQSVSLRQAIENNDGVRVALAFVKESFDKRGKNTIDIRAKLKQTNNNEVLSEGQIKDVKDEVIALSGADIYVEVEVKKNYSQDGNSATVILSAFDAYSGESYANKVATSPKFFTSNFDKLIEKAVEFELDNFLQTLQQKFDDIRTNGRTLSLTFGVLDGAKINLNEEINNSDELLSEVIETWMRDNAFKNNYHLQGTTNSKMIFDLVKIPVLDEKGGNYKVSTFVAQIRKFFKSINIKTSQITQGNNVVFTLSANP